MNYIFVVSILMCMVLAFWFYKSKTKPTEIIDEWNQKVNTARLSKELFSKANNHQEKEDLIYYFTQRIRKNDNYGKASFLKMPETLKTIYLINELEAEVNNGGFIQFLTNSSGKYTNETIQSLELISAIYTKNLLEKAVETILKYNEITESLNRKISSRKLYELFKASEIYDNEDLMNELNELDSKFYEYNDSISELKIKYFEKNEGKIWSELKEKYDN